MLTGLQGRQGPASATDMGGGAALIRLAFGDPACKPFDFYNYIIWLNKKRAPIDLECLHSTERILSQEVHRTLFRLDMPTELNYLALNLNLESV